MSRAKLLKRVGRRSIVTDMNLEPRCTKNLVRALKRELTGCRVSVMSLYVRAGFGERVRMHGSSQPVNLRIYIINR